METITITTVTTATVKQTDIPDGYILTSLPKMRAFKCSYCQAEFKASHKHFTEGSTVWSCICPVCGRRCYTKK